MFPTRFPLWLYGDSGLLTDPHHQSLFVAAELEGVLSRAGSVGRGVCRPSSSLLSSAPAGIQGGSSHIAPAFGFCGKRPLQTRAHLRFSSRRELALAPGLTALPFLSQQVKLEEFGRPKIDGELKVRSIVNHTKQDR